MKKTVLNALVRGTVCALVLAVASPVVALDPQPKTYRERQRHDFRDVQLGLSHPAPHGRSTPVDTTRTRNETPAPRTTDAGR